MRTLEESKRLALEEVLARKQFPNVRVTERGQDVCYTDWVKGRGFHNRYQLELTLPEGSMHRQPRLRVTRPSVLPLHGNHGTINEMDTSHSYHVYSSGGGPVHICFASDWTAYYTCVLALWRGFLWLTAYEIHLVTGRTIAEIIDSWKAKSTQ
jgi:hypothetical protein